METTSFWLLALLWVSKASAVIVEDPPREVTTEAYDFPPYITTEEATESPKDNGMAIGDMPEEVAPSNPPTAFGEKDEEPTGVEHQTFLITFPDNHKNFTPSQYLGDYEYPTYQLNDYQQQYKHYYKQKDLYNRKPIKFDENFTKNFYQTQGINSYLPSEVDNKKLEQSRLNHKPFPYTFENERTPENWYKNTGSGQIDLHDDRAPSTDYLVHGQQEHIVLPHYVFPHSSPQEHKFYEDELIHHEHHEVTKHHTTGNAWKKVLRMLTALVPIGLILATLTPNIISINSTTNSKLSAQRSVDSSGLKFTEEDIFRVLRDHGVHSFGDSQCEDRVICELARMGDRSAANSIEKGFWYLANETPWEVAEKAGMSELFKAIKTGNCESFKCESKTDKRKGLGKKLMRKSKMQLK